jgi:formylglycine-generating enzyme required for sulfatase activity
MGGAQGNQANASNHRKTPEPSQGLFGELIMLICPNGHGPKEGRYCSECKAELIVSSSAGDVLRIRSPEAHANVSVVLPTAAPTVGPPALVKCPKCGRHNPETEVFDCQGSCGRQHLCARHFDEEYDLCRDCAVERRGVAQQEAARLAKLQADLAEWRGRAERAEAQLAEIAARAEAEAKAKAEATWRAAEAAKGQPAWQRIGIELIRISAGEFLYGEDKRKVTLPEYWIARTPVTNTQYKAFVDATGYRPPQHWQVGQIPKGKENHPVVNVDWTDAGNFSAWAGVRLPTEQEWEKAARGTDGREYPWGAWQPGRSNSAEAGIGTTTPVDRFPSGASPYGVLDIAGNVWEWCADWSDSSRQYRVLRGGSFDDNAQSVRCAIRYRNFPETRREHFGFRVASPGL